MASDSEAMNNNNEVNHGRFPDVDALQFMSRSPPGSVQESTLRPEDSVSMTARRGRASSNIVVGLPPVILEHVDVGQTSWATPPKNVINIWKREIVGMFIACAALAGIITLLRLWSGKPTRNWTRHITINTVISILATCIRASTVVTLAEILSQLKWSWYKKKGQAVEDVVLFDRSSRGPCGALQLILSIHPIHMAWVTSVLLVLSFTIEPCLQQAITSQPQRTPQSLPANNLTSDSCRVDIAQSTLSEVAETYFIVRWRWLVLPAIVVRLTLFVLLATIVRTRKECILKSSASGLLSMGAQIGRLERYNGRYGARAMRNGSKKDTHVRVDENGCWDIVNDN